LDAACIQPQRGVVHLTLIRFLWRFPVKKLLLLSLAAALAFAQQQAPVVHPPDVQTDGRITFRLFAPNAHQVSVNIEGEAAALPMQKDEQGVWSATSAALAPNIYGYSFTADLAHIIDPVNTKIKPNLLNLSNWIEVPGAAPAPWDQADIPHGEVDHHFYHSAVVGDNRDYFVYTPPGYSATAATTYPVLYLLHGFSDDASGWSSVGKANLILDTLIASNQARPMIVVMPLGYGAPDILNRTGRATSNPSLRERNMANFRTALIDEVIPAVEQAYRVDTDRNARAIAGLSMGGAESLLTGLNRLDKFSWVGAFSAGGAGDDFAAAFPQAGAEMNQKLHLLWIACGTEDRLIDPNRKLIAWLNSKDVTLTAVETPGMHTWMVWRHNLISFAPLLFQKPAGATATASPQK
jgi:enterochelin esterase-like enzyme